MADLQLDTVVLEVLELKDLTFTASDTVSLVVLQPPKTKKKIKANKGTTKFEKESKIVLIMPKGIVAAVIEVNVGKKPIGTARVPLSSLQPYNTEHETSVHITSSSDGGTEKSEGIMRMRAYLFPKREQQSSTPRRTQRKYQTPLFRALEENDLYGLLVALDDRKLDPNVQDEDGWTAAHHACAKWENENWINLMLRHPGARVDIPNRDGNTVLHTFCQKYRNPNCEQTFQLLMQRGADVNARNSQNETPLHKAVFNPRIRLMLVEMLLKNGAKLDWQSESDLPAGGTVLHYAVQLGRNDLVTILISGGASLTLTDSKKRTPLDLARELHYDAVLRKMQDYQTLGTYLDDVGAGAFKQQFFQKQLFKYKLKDLTESSLAKLQIDIPAGLRLKLLKDFKDIKDVDPMAAKPIIKQTQLDEKEQREELEKTISKGAWVLQESDLEFTKLLGTGTAGEVYRGLYKNQDVAIKILKMSSGREVQEFRQEFEIISALESPFVVKLWGAVITDKLKMVMEYCGRGSLYDVLCKMHWEVGWTEFFSFTENLLQGMVALHFHTPQILHRDLKSLNLLVTDDWVVKLCDFGLSRFDAEDMATLCKLRGTFAYTAPEVYFGTKYTAMSDVFSIGIIMWEMVYRVINQKYQRPYNEYPELKMDFQIIIKTATQNIRPTLPSSTPAPLATLIRQTMVRDQDGRPDCKELLQQVRDLHDHYNAHRQEWERAIVSDRVGISRSPSSGVSTAAALGQVGSTLSGLLTPPQSPATAPVANP